MRALLASAIVLAACGGGGDGGGGPSPVVGMNLVRADPPSGSTITLVHDRNGFARVDVTVTLSVVSDKDIDNTVALVEWIEGGTVCGANIGPIVSVPELRAHRAQTVTIPPQADVVWSCPLPARTTTLKVIFTHAGSVFCFSSCSFPNFSRELSLQYTFVAS